MGLGWWCHRSFRIYYPPSGVARAATTQQYVYPDPDAEFAEGEVVKFRGEILKKLAKEEEEFGDSLNEVVNVCEQRFATRSRGMHRGFASQLCGICEEKKVNAVRGWLAWLSNN